MYFRFKLQLKDCFLTMKDLVDDEVDISAHQSVEPVVDAAAGNNLRVYAHSILVF
jgi:hypothetical protein